MLPPRVTFAQEIYSFANIAKGHTPRKIENPLCHNIKSTLDQLNPPPQRHRHHQCWPRVLQWKTPRHVKGQPSLRALNHRLRRPRNN